MVYIKLGIGATTITSLKKTNVQFTIENILDRNCRYFVSGFSAPAEIT